MPKLTRQSFIDYPDKIAAIIWMHGCNLRCPYCHNQDLLTGQDDTTINILRYLEDRVQFLDGVVISGGEPLFDAKNTYRYLEEIRKIGLSVKLDTNGCYPDDLEISLDDELIDYVAIDVKGDMESYSQCCMRGYEDSDSVYKRVMHSVKILLDDGIDFEIRTTMAPDICDYAKIKRVSSEVSKTILDVDEYYNEVYQELTSTSRKAKWYLQEVRGQSYRFEKDTMLWMARELNEEFQNIVFKVR